MAMGPLARESSSRNNGGADYDIADIMASRVRQPVTIILHLIEVCTPPTCLLAYPCPRANSKHIPQQKRSIPILCVFMFVCM